MWTHQMLTVYFLLLSDQVSLIISILSVGRFSISLCQEHLLYTTWQDRKDVIVFATKRCQAPMFMFRRFHAERVVSLVNGGF